MKKELIRYSALIVILLIIAIFVYPTLYQYDKFDQKIPVRINRLTGKTELLYPTGWTLATEKPIEKNLDAQKPASTPDLTPNVYNGETFKQYYERVIKELTGETAPNKNTLFFRWERVRLGLDDKLVDPKDYFTIGSTKEDVKKVMGPPTSINKYFDRWEYANSSVTFENGKVKEYSDSSNKLFVR